MDVQTLKTDPDVLFTGVTDSTNFNKTASLGCLTEQEFALIEDAHGWLDCSIIHQAQVYLSKINPDIQGFQRPTLGPCGNFDIVGGEFVQIMHTGGNHWVCLSSIGCVKGHVNLYDSLFHDVVCDDIKDQARNLMGDEFRKLSIVPVQQQKNGSDCGVFSIAYAASLVFLNEPRQYNMTFQRCVPTC